jgi:predicted kinase
MTGCGDRRPLLVLVSGAPGSGKSTLACRLAAQEALWLPLLSVDAFKRGLAETQGIDLALDPDVRSTITQAAAGAFFAAIRYFVGSGLSG